MGSSEDDLMDYIFPKTPKRFAPDGLVQNLNKEREEPKEPYNEKFEFKREMDTLGVEYDGISDASQEGLSGGNPLNYDANFDDCIYTQQNSIIQEIMDVLPSALAIKDALERRVKILDSILEGRSVTQDFVSRITKKIRNIDSDLKFVCVLQFKDLETNELYEPEPDLTHKLGAPNAKALREIIDIAYKTKEWSSKSIKALINEVNRQCAINNINNIMQANKTKPKFNDIDWERIGIILNKSPASCKMIWLNINSNKDATSKEHFNGQDKKMLIKSVKEHGTRSWIKIASGLGRNYTPLKCFQYYISHLHKSSEKRKFRAWTPEEDRDLIESIKYWGCHNWIRVSSRLDRRTPNQCLHRWIILTKKKCGKWTPEEDELLIEAVNKFGTHDWTAVAEMIPDRNGSQCRERYHNSLNRSMKKGHWDQEERERLKELILEYGVGNWSLVASKMKNRTDNAIHRAYKHLKKKGFFDDIKDIIQQK